jgi:hypothetical protein
MLTTELSSSILNRGVLEVTRDTSWQLEQLQ